MAQIREIVMLSALPPNLQPSLTSAQYTTEEQNDVMAFDLGQGTTTDALNLYFEQRRKTRNFVIGCSVAAAALGGFMGYFVGKKS